MDKIEQYKKQDNKLKKILDYLNEKKILTVTFEQFIEDENKTPNINWRAEVWENIEWINFGNGGNGKRGGENRLKEIFDKL